MSFAHVTVVVPWRDGGCEHRLRAKHRVVAHLATALPGAELVLADDGLDPWARGASIDKAVAEASGELILTCDSDLLIPAEQLRAALALAEEKHGQVIPFARYRYLGESETARLLATGSERFGDFRHKWTRDVSVGGSGAFSVETWEIAGGHDPRFRGWGGQDYGFYYACEALVGPLRRVPGEAVHLFHPADPTNDKTAPSYDRNMALIRAYSDAAKAGPEAMRALIAERDR